MNFKKYLLILMLGPLMAFAQTGTPPAAGITPQNPFYFLDRLGEALQEFLAFSPEAKIRIQISFAAERIAEIQVDMKAKNVEAKGLSVAQNRLEGHLLKASKLVSEEKKKGKNVKEFSEVLKDEFEASKKVLELSFEVAKDALEDEREEIKKELELVKKSNNTIQAEALKLKLEELEDEKDELELRKEEQKQSLEDEKERLDDDSNLEEELEDVGKDLDEIEIED